MSQSKKKSGVWSTFVWVHYTHSLSPQILLASWMSLGIIVTHLACILHRLVSLNNETKYASATSCKL